MNSSLKRITVKFTYIRKTFHFPPFLFLVTMPDKSWTLPQVSNKFFWPEKVLNPRKF